MYLVCNSTSNMVYCNRRYTTYVLTPNCELCQNDTKLWEACGGCRIRTCNSCVKLFFGVNRKGNPMCMTCVATYPTHRVWPALQCRDKFPKVFALFGKYNNTLPKDVFRIIVTYLFSNEHVPRPEFIHTNDKVWKLRFTHPKEV